MNTEDYEEAVERFFTEGAVSNRDAWYVLLTVPADRIADEIAEARGLADDPEYDKIELVKAVIDTAKVAKEHINEL